MNTKNNKSFKRVGEIHDGINRLVSIFLDRAKTAHKYVLSYKKQYDEGCSWAHELYLRHRAERCHWLWAAKQLLLNTTNGVVHGVVNARVISRLLECNAQKIRSEMELTVQDI